MMSLPPDLRMVMVRGQGSRIYDAAGKEYLDYMLGSGPLILGHCHPKVVEAVQRQVGLSSTYFALNEPAIALAEVIVESVPCGEALRFQTTGSEATFSALRIARAFTKRDKILKFEGGWHGGHDVGQLSGAPAAENPFPDAVPDCDGIPQGVQHDVVVAPLNDLATTVSIIERHRDELAAVIVEPLQRSLVPESGFLSGLREITRDCGIVLIFDEIVTGFRIAWGGARAVRRRSGFGLLWQNHWRRLPAFCGRRKEGVDAACRSAAKGTRRDCFLSGTLTGNPVACAVGRRWKFCGSPERMSGYKLLASDCGRGSCASARKRECGCRSSATARFYKCFSAGKRR